MRRESEEELGIFGQRKFFLYHQAETYFVLSERQHDVVHGTESRRWESNGRVVVYCEETESLQSEKQR